MLPKAEDDTREMTQRVWDNFEKAIREHPECWLWMYKHWRYTPLDDACARDPRYPAYSYASAAFREMVPEEMRP
jgi:lauroyl/myristoyl acyltransferase